MKLVASTLQCVGQSVLLAFVIGVPILSRTAIGESSIKTGDFINIGPGGGGTPGTLDVDPRNPNLIYCGLDCGGVRVSEDGGRSWQNRNRGIKYRRNVGWASHHGSLMLPDGRLLIGSGDGIHETTDRGRTWGRVLDCRWKVGSLARCAGIPEVVYAGTGKGYGLHHLKRLRKPGVSAVTLNHNRARGGGVVFRSAQSGRAKSWNQVNKGKTDNLPGEANVIALAVDPVDPNRVYATTDFGLYRSVDGGKSWHSIQAPLGESLPRFILTVPGKPRLVYLTIEAPAKAEEGTLRSGVVRSVDGGDTWEPMNKGILAKHKKIWALAIDPVNPEVLYLGSHDWDGALYRSIDGARSWSVLLDRRTPERMENGEWGWQSSQPHVAVGACIRVTGGDADGDGLSDCLFFVGDNGGQIWRSENGGAMWRQIYTRKKIIGGKTYWSGRGEIEFLCARTIVVDPTNSDHLFVSYFDWPPLESVDGGESFALAAPTWIENELIGSVKPIVLDPDDPKVVYFGRGRRPRGGGGGIYRRLPGERFKNIGGGKRERGRLPNGSVLALRIVRQRELLPPKKYLYATVGGHGVYRLNVLATPQGRWEKVSEGLETENSLSFYALESIPGTPRLYVGTHDGVFVSDGEQHWQRLTGSDSKWPKIAVVRSLATDASDPKTLYACVMKTFRSDPDDGIYLTRDGGKTWKKIATVDIPHEVVSRSIPDTRRLLVASQSQGVMELLEDAKSGRWTTKIFADPTNGLDHTRCWTVATDPSRPERVYIGTHATGVYKNWHR